MSISIQTIETLEFPKVRQHLARYTSFSASRELALDLLPSTDKYDVARLIHQTSEARKFLDHYPDTHIGGAHDIRVHAQRAERGGILDPSHLLDTASTLTSMRLLHNALKKLDSTAFPDLTSYTDYLPDLITIEQEIERTIDEDATVRDTASAELGRIRSAMQTTAARLQERLNHMVTSSQFSTVLQESLVTVRNGRYVVPVKASHRRSVPGLVHDQSASGATLYIEPMAVVEANNRLRELEAEEQQEIARILTMISSHIGTHAETIVQGVETLALLDLAFARARYAHALVCIEPEISSQCNSQPISSGAESTDIPEPLLSILEARHPLLDQQKVVPVTIWMDNAQRILVVTGPNTGGKTVALKTIGLLALMTQAGLHIPAREPSRLPIFAHIFADIGDEQSIEQSLSTFSSHMTTIIRMLNQIEQREPIEDGIVPTLVLLDEIGAGTDPTEGAALARSIIEWLLEHDCMGIVTTHYAELKVFAHNTPGVQNASVEFDSETLAPTYKLTIGVPGRSNALAIAARLGLNRAIVDRAQGTISQDTVHLDELLEDIHCKQEAVVAELQRAQELRNDAEKYRNRLAEHLQEFEDVRQEHMNDALREVEEEVRELRSELRRAHESARRAQSAAQSVQSAQPAQPTTVPTTTDKQPDEPNQPVSADEHLKQAETLMKQLTHKQRQTTAPAQVLMDDAAFAVGDTVLVRSIGLTGQIVALDENDDMADVQVGSFRVHVSIGELRRDKSQTKSDKHTPPARSERTGKLPEMPDVSMSLDMRGWRTADVPIELERYLNDAYMSGFPQVEIIHGKGSGALRHMVRDMVRKHPLVQKFCSGGEAGGEGVTVVTFVER